MQTVMLSTAYTADLGGLSGPLDRPSSSAPRPSKRDAEVGLDEHYDATVYGHYGIGITSLNKSTAHFDVTRVPCKA